MGGPKLPAAPCVTVFEVKAEPASRQCETGRGNQCAVRGAWGESPVFRRKGGGNAGDGREDSGDGREDSGDGREDSGDGREDGSGKGGGRGY